MIWRESLPEQDAPALFFYKKGCWLATNEEEEDDETGDSKSFSLRFHHYLLDHVPVRMPLAFVNHEARRIALAWVVQQGIRVVYSAERQRHYFVRAFDPCRDAVYVSQAKWTDFCGEGDECIDEMFQDVRRFTSGSDVLHIALPANIIGSGDDSTRLHELFNWHVNIGCISLIVGTSPDLEKELDNSVGSGENMRRRWELRARPESTFTWDKENHCFRRNTGAWVERKSLHHALEYASTELFHKVDSILPPSFRIQLVSVVSD